MKRIKIIHPASKAPEDTLGDKIIELKNLGFSVEATPTKGHPKIPWLANDKSTRLKELSDALQDNDTDIILCGRGGYGASDLLDELPWQNLRALPPKLLCGFSDISALHSAIVTHLDWPCLHSPMPNTDYWLGEGSQPFEALINILNDVDHCQGKIALEYSFGHTNSQLSGKLFGGCLSVLTNLIGTPHFPSLSQDHIIFWEDIGESPAKILRNINQWIQAGALQRVTAIVMGDFANLDSFQSLDKKNLCEEVAMRTGKQVFSSCEFGHCPKNLPILVNSLGSIHNNTLFWKQRKPYDYQA